MIFLITYFKTIEIDRYDWQINHFILHSYCHYFNMIKKKNVSLNKRKIF